MEMEMEGTRLFQTIAQAYKEHNDEKKKTG